MKLAFRWYGFEDKVPLNYIRQIPNMEEIVSAVYDVPVGDVWPNEKIAKLKQSIEQCGLVFETVESVPVHEAIKLGKTDREKYILNYQQTLRNLASYGIKTVCYNFMPIFDWTRTNLAYENKDGSTSLALSQQQLASINPMNKSLSLPGWDESYTREELSELFEAYAMIDEEQLWQNLTHFLSAIIPVAEEVGINMAIHPDDPPYSIFGLPRIITGIDSYKRLFKINPTRNNGVTFCSGSLGSSVENDLSQILSFCLAEGKVHFVHLRNVRLHENNDFEETAHPSNMGSIDMVALMKLLHAHRYKGPLRPDHGRMIFGETGRPGYGLYDRALGASYLYGVWEALT